jgi:hypothetical protein
MRKNAVTQPEYDAVRDSIATVIEKSYPFPPEVVKNMDDSATEVLKAHDRRDRILAIGQEIAEEDAELLRLLAQ